MPRMRFAQQAYEEILKDDPDSPISLRFIRTLSASGKIPVVMVGKRRLINYDALLEYLANPPQEDEPGYGQIRRIAQ